MTTVCQSASGNTAPTVAVCAAARDTAAVATMEMLTVCTHNRTRSVIMSASLDRRLREVGCKPQITSGGFRTAGRPPTETTVRLLAELGIEVGDHRSQLIDDSLVSTADLILCAEREHVVTIAGRYPGSFARAFTMPEFARLGEVVGSVDGDLPGWLRRVEPQRPPGLDYLDVDASTVGEIRDPTACPPKVWAEVVRHIDDLAVRIARVMAP